MFDPYNARTSLVRYILPLFVLVVMVVMLQMMLDMRSRASALKAEACEESDFRQQHVTPGLYRSIWKAALVEGTGADGFANILTATMLNSGFYPRQVRADSVPYRKYKPEEYERLMEAYQSVWSDLKYFPIPSTEVDFENTYGALRDYGMVLFLLCFLAHMFTSPCVYGLCSEKSDMASPFLFPMAAKTKRDLGVLVRLQQRSLLRLEPEIL